MRKQIFFGIFFVVHCFSVCYAQLKLVPLTYDEARYTQYSPVNTPNKNLQGLRVEAITDSVKAGVSIRIKSGNNPRCVGDNTPIVFEAIPVNSGASPTFEWNVNGVSSGAAKQFTRSNPVNGDQIICFMSSSLPCAKVKLVASNSLTISDSTKLRPTVSIAVLTGDNPACVAKSPITFTSNATNGGTSPTFRWYYNGAYQSTGATFAKDSMANRDYVNSILISSLSCSSKTDTSDRIYRSVVKNTSASVDIALVGISNDACTNNLYQFKALPINGGSNPTYSWYVNGVFVSTTTNGTFYTSLAKNGDNVYVRLNATLSCANPRNPFSKSIIRTDTIKLPFFDDFSTYSGQPDINRWIKNGGTYINNHLCKTPPSYNVASFDGLRYNGAAYDTVTATSRGTADNLTSLPIDLSSYGNSDSTKIVFYWQPQGMGEVPDSSQGDKLSLFFKDFTGNWVEVWKASGSSLKNFSQKIISIDKNATNNFLHKGFQFKFQTNGRLSGMYDVWNVDYIYVGRNISKSLYFRDQAFNKTPKSVLKRYASMPLDHFLINPSLEIDSSTTTSVSNLLNSFNQISLNSDFIDNKNNSFIKNIYSSTSNTIASEARDLKVQVPIGGNPIPSDAKAPYELKTQFSLLGDATGSTDGLGINYTLNNTISGITILDNFFAYDDGTAEYAIGLNQKFGLLAYRFLLSKPDTLEQIAMNIIKMGKISANQSINICVWKSLPKNPNSTEAAKLLFKKNYLLDYSKNVDGFVVFKLDQMVALSDSFYVGYQQISDDVIALGWDKNNNNSKNIFYSTSSTWQNYIHEEGSIMIRPVFGEYHYLNSIENEAAKNEEDQINLFPNPSSGKVCTNVTIDKIEVYNLNGEKVWQQDQIFDNCFEINAVADGFYIVKLKSNGQYFYQKLLLTK